MGIFDKLMMKLIINKITSDGKKVRKRLDKLTASPMKAQEDFLMTLLRDNKDTEFGKRYDFASIHSIEEYRKRVPVSSFDDYSEAVYRMTEKCETNILTVYPIKHFSKSSGTMGNPKRIPFSDKAAQISTDYSLSYLLALLDQEHLMRCAKGLNLIEVSLQTLPNGCSCGAYSGRSIENNRFALEKIFIPSFEVMIPKGNMNSRHLQAFYALYEKDLSYCVCAFYSYFLEVLRYIEKNWELLADDMEKGRFDDSIQMPDEVRVSLQSKLKPDPKRAEEIRAVFRSPSQTWVPRIWPNFRFLAGIGTAGFSTYTGKLKEYFGPTIHFYMYGVQASEAVFSTPIRIDSGESVLIPESVFYEFLPIESSDYSQLLTLDQLEIGKNYEVVMTNLSGFYRYKMRDVVHVVGKYNNTPTIEFLFRADQTVNLVGEKTTEYALREVVKKTAKECGFEMVDYCMYPNPETVPVRYEFLIEPAQLPDDFDMEKARDILDKNLAIANPSMGDKLKRGIVGRSELYFLQQETCLLYRDMMIMKGVSSAQLKPVRIIDNPLKKNFFYTLIDKNAVSKTK